MWRFIGKVCFSLALASAAYWLCEQFKRGSGPIGIVFTAGVWARLFSRDFLEFILAIKYWGERSAVFKWHGSYYSFDGRQIRFFLVDAIVWVPLADIKPLMEPELGERELRLLGAGHALIPGEKIIGLSEPALLQLLKIRTESRHASYKMIRLKRWLISSALVNIKRLPRSAIN